MTKLSETPLIHPTAVVSDTVLGRYTEIDENCRVSEADIADLTTNNFFRLFGKMPRPPEQTAWPEQSA